MVVLKNSENEESNQASEDDSVQLPQTQQHSNNNTFPSFTQTYESVATNHRSSFAMELEDDRTPHPQHFGLYPYYRVLRDYPMYRAYFVAHVCQNLGDWFVQIASLLVLEAWNTDDQPGGDGQAISQLMLSRLLPRVFFAQLGGVLSDRWDRRQSMIVLDITAGVVVLGFLLALQFQSLSWIYCITFARNTLVAIYYPITTGIVPLLISDPSDLQYAVTINNWAWAWTSVLGGLLAGSMAGTIGLGTCYVLDSVTYFVSAVVVAQGIRGNFNVASTSLDEVDASDPHQTHGKSQDSTSTSTTTTRPHPILAVLQNLRDVIIYLWSCGFGIMILLKASASLIWGIEDIVDTELATVFDVNTGMEDAKASSWNMGLVFTLIGVGSTVGPALATAFSDAKYPFTLQRAACIGVTLMALGWCLVGLSNTFPQFLGFTLVRTIGGGIAWVYPTLILQTLTDPSMLGRVLALEDSLSTLTQAVAAATAGYLATHLQWNPHQIAFFGCGTGGIIAAFWWIAIRRGMGASNTIFNPIQTLGNTNQSTILAQHEEDADEDEPEADMDREIT